MQENTTASTTDKTAVADAPRTQVIATDPKNESLGKANPTPTPDLTTTECVRRFALNGGIYEKLAANHLCKQLLT